MENQIAGDAGGFVIFAIVVIAAIGAYFYFKKEK